MYTYPRGRVTTWRARNSHAVFGDGSSTETWIEYIVTGVPVPHPLYLFETPAMSDVHVAQVPAMGPQLYSQERAIGLSYYSRLPWHVVPRFSPSPEYIDLVDAWGDTREPGLTTPRVSVLAACHTPAPPEDTAYVEGLHRAHRRRDMSSA